MKILLKQLNELKSFVKKHTPKLDSKDENFMCEFLLWGLSAFEKSVSN